jgi:hypothetical protein
MDFYAGVSCESALVTLIFCLPTFPEGIWASAACYYTSWTISLWVFSALTAIGPVSPVDGYSAAVLLTFDFGYSSDFSLFTAAAAVAATGLFWARDEPSLTVFAGSFGVATLSGNPSIPNSLAFS